MIRRITKPVFRLLFVLLCTMYRVYMAMKGVVCCLAQLFFNRQTRYKIFPFLSIDQDQVINRIRLLGKLPPSLILCPQISPQDLPNSSSVLFKMIVWSSRLDIKHVTIFVLNSQNGQLRKQLQEKLQQLDPAIKQSKELRLGNTMVRLESIKGFYNRITEQIKKEGSVKCEESQSPLLVLFNKCRSLTAVPFEYLVSGEILFEEGLPNYTIIDYERNLKDYASTKQRCGK